ncbi:tetratricopeptide repeat protein [Kitasatospora phosalacinea]|uniref:Tetratricopeptide repeat protein n=1 Tax=Kitasatospora phosalacinea TaxID=2065 RepID=A0ABW6GTZ5_9ACTN
MEVRILGPVEVRQDDDPVDIQPRTLQFLAILLLAPGLSATHAEINSCLWPEKKPDSNRIRQYSRKLRHEVPDITLANDGRFCRLRIDPHRVDYLRFRTHREIAGGAPDPASELAALKAALAEHRGEPLRGMPGPEFAAHRADLVTQLQDTTVDCVRAELACKQLEAAHRRVSAAQKRWPDSEPLLELRVRILGALGRTGEIGPLLEDWREQFKRPIVHLLLSRAAKSTTQQVPVRPVPRQLPPRSPALVGRGDQVERLCNTLLGRTAGRSKIVTVSGMPGIGKTVFAISAGRTVEEHFPDGTLYADLRGYNTQEPEHFEYLLVRFLNNLGVEPDTPTRDGMLAAYRTALADRSVLVVLDNARDEKHVRNLLPGLGRSAAIVTSRRQLHGLAIQEGADMIGLAPLGRTAALELLREHLGDQRMGQVSPFVDELVECCAGVPLALSITAAHILVRGTGAVGKISHDLRTRSTRLQQLDLGSDDQSVRLSFEVSYDLLPAPAKQLFWQLAVHPGPTISWSAVRALLSEDGAEFSSAGDELVRNHLLGESSGSRYGMHDLLRAYAEELAARQGPGERAEVAERILEFLLQNAASCDRLLDPDRRLPVGAAKNLRIDVPRNIAAATAWFEAEYSTLTAVIGTAETYGLDRHTWLVPMTLVAFQWRSGRYLDALRHLPTALEAARRVASPVDVAMVHRMLGGTHRGLGDLARATREMRSAARLSEEHGDKRGVALANSALGAMLREGGAPNEAFAHHTAALAAFQELDDVLGQGGALDGIGAAHHDLQRFALAQEHYRRALEVLAGTEDLNGQAHAWFGLGRSQVALGSPRDAIVSFTRALRLYRSFSYASRQVRTLISLSDAFLQADRPRMAAEALSQARSLLTALGESDPDAAVERLRNQL